MIDAVVLFFQTHDAREIMLLAVVGLITLSASAILLAVAWMMVHSPKDEESGDLKVHVESADKPKYGAIERFRDAHDGARGRVLGAAVREAQRPRPGDRRWSNYFQGTIELVEYVSDTEFYFRLIDSASFPKHGNRILKNHSTWSTLALRRPDDAPIGRGAR